MSDPTPPPESNARKIVGGDEIAGDKVMGDNVTGDKHIHNYPPPPPVDPFVRNPTTPKIWNVPHNRNPNLVGRTAELDQIRTSFGVGDLASIAEHAHTSRPPGWVEPPTRKHIIALTQTITGLGGIGKTSLAVEYCYQHQDAYDIVWWLRSQDSATLATDYAALAVKLDPSLVGVADTNILIEFVRDYLRQHARWLLIFDNANHPNEIRDFLPPPGSGHILITSRDPNWDEIAANLSLKLLPRADSIRLLSEQSGDTDLVAADALAHALGDLPLALEHARAYVAKKPSTLVAYLELFNKRHTDLWNAANKPEHYHSTIATTWDISFDAVKAKNPAAADLLNLCAFFAPDDIPLDVIRARKVFLVEPLLSVVSDPIQLDEVVSLLRAYSLVERKKDDLNVHRLVQIVTRDRLSENARKQWVEAAVKIVNSVYPFESHDVRTWKDCERLLQHGLDTARYAETENTAILQAVRLFNMMGIYLQGRAQFVASKALLEGALILCEREYGNESLEFASTVNNLGLLRQEQGDLDGAKAAYEQALAIDERHFGPHHLKVANRVNNLGGVMRDLGDLEGAKAAFERALTIAEVEFGREHPNVAIIVNNLGGVLLAQGNLDGAKEAYERALAIDEKQFGPDHPIVARGMNNLGNFLQALGDLAGAKAAYERAHMILQQSLGDDHPNTRLVKRNLDSLLPS